MITKARKERVWGDNYPMLMMIYQIEKIMLKEHIYKLAERLYGATKNNVDKFINECMEVGFLKRKQIGLQNKWMYMLTKYPIMKIEGKNSTREVATIVPSAERIKLSLLKTEYLLNKEINDINMFDKKCNSVWNINKTESLKFFEYLKNLNIPLSTKFVDDYELEQLKYKRLKKIATKNEIQEIKSIQERIKKQANVTKNNRIQPNEGKEIPNLLYYQELYTISNFLGSGFRINNIKKKNDTQIVVQVIYYNLSELNTGNIYKNIALFYNLINDYIDIKNKDIIIQTFFYGIDEDVKKFNFESLEIKKNFYTGTLCKNQFYKNKLLAYGISSIDFNNNKVITKTKELNFSKYNLALDNI
ncbi:MAG: hypothetical protein RR904_05360 [Bacilli bacterium]